MIEFWLKFFKKDGIDDLTPEELENIKVFNLLRRENTLLPEKGIIAQ